MVKIKHGGMTELEPPELQLKGTLESELSVVMNV